MTQEERVKDYKLFLKTWGQDAQINMCIEEMSELTKALCKYFRKKDVGLTPEQIYNIKEEIADVLNMAEQMREIFGYEEIEKIRDEKMARTLTRLND